MSIVPAKEEVFGPFLVRLEKIRGVYMLTAQVRSVRVEIRPPYPGGSRTLQVAVNGSPLFRRVRRKLPFITWLRKPEIKRWVLLAANEFDGEVPCWSTKQISKNLLATGRGEASPRAIAALIWRYPDLNAKRRRGWALARTKTGVSQIKLKQMSHAKRLAELDAVTRNRRSTAASKTPVIERT